MSANILIKMYKKCQENEELKFFFNGYVECLISGKTAMYWNIEDKNNLQIIKDFLLNSIKIAHNYIKLMTGLFQIILEKNM